MRWGSAAPSCKTFLAKLEVSSSVSSAVAVLPDFVGFDGTDGGEEVCPGVLGGSGMVILEIQVCMCILYRLIVVVGCWSSLLVVLVRLF